MFDSIGQAFNQLNPLSTPNLIIYFSWIVIYVVTAATIWRANNRYIRLGAFIVNQVFSVGIVISTVNVVVVAVVYPWESAGAVVGSAFVYWLMFRPRKNREKKPAAAPPQPASAEQGDWAPRPPVLPPPGPRIDPPRHREDRDVTGKEFGRLTDDWLTGKLPTEEQQRGRRRDDD